MSDLPMDVAEWLGDLLGHLPATELGDVEDAGALRIRRVGVRRVRTLYAPGRRYEVHRGAAFRLDRDARGYERVAVFKRGRYAGVYVAVPEDDPDEDDEEETR